MKDNNIIITLIWTWKSCYILLWLVQRNLSGLWFIFTNISSLSLCGKCINNIYFLVMGVPSLMRPRDLETLLLHLTPSRYLLTIKAVSRKSLLLLLNMFHFLWLIRLLIEWFNSFRFCWLLCFCYYKGRCCWLILLLLTNKYKLWLL